MGVNNSKEKEILHNKYTYDRLFIEAAKNGDTYTIELLITKGKYNVNRTPVAFIYASEYGHKNIIELLLKAGVNVNIADSYGDTALMIASKQRRKNIVELLISEGADVNAKNRHEKTALKYAIEYGSIYVAEYIYIDIIKLLLKAGALASTSEEDFKNMVKLLISKGEDIDIDNNGNTALMYASEKGYIDIVDLLLKAGANVNKQNENGDTALIIACEKNFNDIVYLLLTFSLHFNVNLRHKIFS